MVGSGVSDAEAELLLDDTDDADVAEEVKLEMEDALENAELLDTDSEEECDADSTADCDA